MGTPSFQKTKRIIITSFVGCLFFVSLYGLFFYYIRSLNNGVADLKNKVADTKIMEEENRSAEQTFQETIKNRDLIDTFFVGADQEEEAAFVNSLENLAADVAKISLDTSGLRHEEIAGFKNGKMEYLVVQANARGSFSGVYQYLTLLESFPKGVIVRQVEMEAISGDPKKPREWRFSFVLQALKVK